MKKFIGTSLLVVVSLWLAGGGDTLGQERKRPPTKSTVSTGTIEIIESRDGKFRFSVRDSEGKYLAGSPVGHETANEAREAVEELKKVIANARYVNKKAETDKKTETDKKDK